MSWLMYATRSTMRTIFASSVSGSTGPVCVRMPSQTSCGQVQVARDPVGLLVVAEPEPRSGRGAPGRARPRRRVRTACVPCRARGRSPRSGPRSDGAPARRPGRSPSSRACASSACGSGRPAGSMKTCVFPFRRRNGFEWTIRSRSRWNGVRTPHSSSSARVRASRTSARRAARASVSSCSRTRASKASATFPASSGIVLLR